jgi:hypothetical protein
MTRGHLNDTAISTTLTDVTHVTASADRFDVEAPIGMLGAP